MNLKIKIYWPVVKFIYGDRATLYTVCKVVFGMDLVII